jgi:hypothetical protein
MERIESDTWEPAQPECRALVIADTGASRPNFALTHSSAAFLTQLLAIKAGLPQTRERRREEPDVAAHFYEAGMTAPPQHAGSTLRRAL